MHQYIPVIMLFMVIPTQEIQSSLLKEHDISISPRWGRISNAAEVSRAGFFPCIPGEPSTGLMFAAECILAIILVILMGVLAGLGLAVRSVDLTKLLVWTKTGGKKQRKQAAKILEVRSRPDWLLTSLILASVMVAEGFPLVLNHLLPSRILWAPFLISSTVVVLFAEMIPQAVMPLYSLEFSGRSIWLIKLIMYLMALPACLLAFGLKKFRQWQRRVEQHKLDGILEMDELIEFVRLHEQGERHGGRLTDGAGTLVRTIMEYQKAIVGEDIRPWTSIVLLEADSPITPSILKMILRHPDPYVVVTMNDQKECGQIPTEDIHDHDESRQIGMRMSISLAGVVLMRDFVNLDTQNKPAILWNIPIRPVPVVQANCPTQRLLSLLIEKNYPCAFVVSSLKNIPHQDIADISPYLNDDDTLTSETLLPLGLVDRDDLISRVLYGKKTSFTTRRVEDDHRWSTDSPTPQVVDDQAENIDEKVPDQNKHAVDEGVINGSPQQPRSASLGTVVVSKKSDRMERFHASTSGYSPKPRSSIYGRFGAVW